jgi:hypothetical protein
VDADAILQAFANRLVDCILIGGMNFALRHEPVMTFDVDFWVADTDENLQRVNESLRDLGAQWGPDENSWKPVSEDFTWLRRQSIFWPSSAHGAIDIFREVIGLEGQYAACLKRSIPSLTPTGIPYRSLSDADMLACQTALPENLRRLDRVRYLRNLLP